MTKNEVIIELIEKEERITKERNTLKKTLASIEKASIEKGRVIKERALLDAQNALIADRLKNQMTSKTEQAAISKLSSIQARCVAAWSEKDYLVLGAGNHVECIGIKEFVSIKYKAKRYDEAIEFLNNNLPVNQEPITRHLYGKIAMALDWKKAEPEEVQALKDEVSLAGFTPAGAPPNNRASVVYELTNELRYAEKDIPITASTGVTECRLQQKHQGSDGSVKWEWVETVS